MQRLCFKFYLKHWVVPQAVLGFTTVIQLVLTWELVVSHILPGNNPPAPFLLAEPPNEQILCTHAQTFSLSPNKRDLLKNKGAHQSHKDIVQQGTGLQPLQLMAATEKRCVPISGKLFCQNDSEKLEPHAEIFSLLSCSMHTSETTRDRYRHTNAGNETCEVDWGQLCSRLCLSEDLKTERTKIQHG